MVKPRFSLVATGGTFDRFHKGHAALLDKAFSVSEKVIIGITSDQMVAREGKILGEIVVPFAERVKEVQRFLKEKGYSGREIIEKLHDIYGPTVLNGQVEAVVCTRETRSGAETINRKRKEVGNEKLVIIECPFVTSRDNFHISSTRIRQGEINREGELLIDKASGHHHLPQSLRDLLNKPVDKLFENLKGALSSVSNPVVVITIGDVVTSDLIKRGTVPDIGVFDNKVQRKKDNRLYNFDIKVKNGKGTVSEELIKAFKKAIRDWFVNGKKTMIKIDGEEDLAVIPAVLTAPLGSVVYYGQPAIGENPAGVVRVLVTEEKKKWTIELLKKFR